MTATGLLAVIIGRPRELWHRGVTLRVDALSPWYLHRRPKQDLQVQPQVPVADVPHIQLELFFSSGISSKVKLRRNLPSFVKALLVGDKVVLLVMIVCIGHDPVGRPIESIQKLLLPQTLLLHLLTWQGLVSLRGSAHGEKA